MPLTMRPTGLGLGIDQGLVGPASSSYWRRAIGRIYQTRGVP